MILDILKEMFFLFAEMSPYLLLGLIFVAILNLLVNKDIIIKQVGKKNFMSVLKAALFGVPLPLCSCGVIPTAVYMNKNGASNGATISFLISTPQTGIDSILATYGMMGPVFAIFRPLVAFIMGIIGGMTVDAIDKSKPTAMPKFISLNDFKPKVKPSLSSRIKQTLNYAFVEFLDDISVQFVVGVVIAGLIAYFLPADFIANSGFNTGLPAMLIMVAVGIPMYVCATASIPIALTLMMKGFSPGAAFVFLVAGPATNAASIAIITKSIGKNLTIVYLLTIIVLSLVFGYLLDLIYPYLADIPGAFTHVHNHNHGGMIEQFKIFIACIFMGMIILSFYRKYFAKYFRKKEKQVTNECEIHITGMTCNHCVSTVKKTIENIKGVQTVDVKLDENAAYIKGDFDVALVKAEIEKVGYKAE